MEALGMIIMMAVFAALGLTAWGAFRSQRSIMIAVVATVVAILATGCGWYAFAESQSLPWTIGYVVLFLVSLSVAIKHARSDQA